MIDSEAFKELIREIAGLLRVSNKVLAHSCGISPSTLENWRRVGISQAAERSSAYRNFDSFMKDDHKRIAYNETGRGTQAVDSAVSEKIVLIYERWLEESRTALDDLPPEVGSALDEPIEERDSSPYTTRQAGDILTRFRTISVYANLVRWRDRDKSCRPFESKTVGMGAIRGEKEIYDELVLFSQNSILQTQDRDFPVPLRTSGVLEAINIDDEQFLLDREVHEQTDGRVMPLHLQVTRHHREIKFVERIYNGFQRGNENLAIRVFDNSITESLHMTVDFSSVLTYSRFLELPTAQYIALGESGRPVSTRNLMQGNIWYAVFEHPKPGSRLQMAWSLK